MRSRRSPRIANLAVLALAATAVAGAQPARPPAGRTVDESREITLRARVDAPCLAVRTPTVSILVARRPLEEAAAATPKSWRSEDGRQALVRGNRAEALLALAKGGADGTGCVPADGSRLTDAAHLVAELLEAGQAAVLGHGASAPDRAITVRYLGMRAGPTAGRGEILFLRGEPRRRFFGIEWWAS